MPVCGSLDIMDSGGKYKLEFHLNRPSIVPVGHVGADGEGTEGVEENSELETERVHVE